MRAKEMIDAGEIGEPQMIRMHVNTGTLDTAILNMDLSPERIGATEPKTG